MYYFSSKIIPNYARAPKVLRLLKTADTCSNRPDSLQVAIGLHWFMLIPLWIAHCPQKSLLWLAITSTYINQFR